MVAAVVRPRFVLVYQDQRIPLPEGEVIVGRSVTCQVRFNAPTVSRQHVRLHIAGASITAENLSTSIGTLHNGRALTAPTPVAAGDELVMGPRAVRLELSRPEDALTAVRPLPALGLLPDGDDEEITETFEIPHDAILSASGQLATHTCPRCRTRVGFEVTRCPSCDHQWSAELPSVLFGQVTSRDISGDIAMPTAVMAVYASDAITVDVTITELHADRAFVPTELLDAPGTICELTLLPDGQSPLLVHGEVSAVRSGRAGGAPAGVEVRFTKMSDGVRLWIDLWLRAHARRA